jgi:hypothetical protein
MMATKESMLAVRIDSKDMRELDEAVEHAHAHGVPVSRSAVAREALRRGVRQLVRAYDALPVEGDTR